MGLFDKKKSISRDELISAFRKNSGEIPKSGGKKFYQREREKIARGIFGLEYGSEISKEDFRDALRNLERAKKSAKSEQEKENIENQIRFLKKIGGKGI